jgi:hypothetical protein
MKKIILSLCCVIGSSLLNINAGVESTTLVHTPQGLKCISTLSVGDEITCYSQELEKTTKTVTAVQSRHYDSCIEVTTADNKIMRLSHDQRVFSPFKWTPAECLAIGDALMNEQRQFVRIVSIIHKEEPISIHFIEVDEHANFMISESGILVHNGPICGGVTYFGIKGLGYFGIVAATATATAAAVAATPVMAGGGAVALTVSGIMAGMGILTGGASAGLIAAGGAMGGLATTAGTTAIAAGAATQATVIALASTAAIEGVAFTAGTWVTLCPFLP